MSPGLTARHGAGGRGRGAGQTGQGGGADARVDRELPVRLLEVVKLVGQLRGVRLVLMGLC